MAFLVSEDTIESKIHPMGHGGEVTTDVIMAVRPELVDLNKATPESCKPAFDFHARYMKYSIFTHPDFIEYCESGGWGNPAYAPGNLFQCPLTEELKPIPRIRRKSHV